jgi:hypothetical protein
MIERNWKKYYTLEESKKKTEDFIIKSADELILELKKRRAEKFIPGTEVVFSNTGKLCIK